MFKQGQSLEPDLLMRFLKLWIEGHIIEVDKHYAEYLISQGVQ
jgi:hemerythrin